VKAICKTRSPWDQYEINQSQIQNCFKKGFHPMAQENGIDVENGVDIGVSITREL